ncbi:MAG: DUF1918 domain-containing protein [Gaiellaceae bacterium]|jgi:hypothetical protein
MAETRQRTGQGRAGDLVVVTAHSLGDTERIGEIREVLGTPDHVHYRVLWEDGRETLFYPSSDATIRPKS